MRPIAFALFSALLFAPAAAGAQEVNRIKASGANAAGACAGSLDMVGQFMSRADQPDTQRLAQVQQARNFFADMPQFPASDITAAANAFVKLMSGRLVNAQTDEERQAVQRELMTLAQKCVKTLQSLPSSPPPPAGGAVAPPVTTVPAQPYTLEPQPYDTQPLPAQPYDSQPLVLDPIVPAQ